MGIVGAGYVADDAADAAADIGGTAGRAILCH